MALASSSQYVTKGVVQEIMSRPGDNPDAELATARVAQLQFGMLKPTDVLKLSHLQIVNRSLYEFTRREPQQWGCLDRRLGTSDKKVHCDTCHKELSHCIGHFGHISLELPVFHIGFFREVRSRSHRQRACHLPRCPTLCPDPPLDTAYVPCRTDAPHSARDLQALWSCAARSF
jgi:hypothetical protein